MSLSALLDRFTVRVAGVLAAPGGAPLKYARDLRERPEGVDVVTYFPLPYSERDGTSRLRLQMDLWGTSFPRVVEMEEMLRADFRALATGPVIDGLRVSAQVDESLDHGDAADGHAHRSFDVTLESAWPA